MKGIQFMKESVKTREQLADELKNALKRVEELEALQAEHFRAIETLRSYKKALETMQIGVTISDLQGNILYINPADLEMHGYSTDLTGEDVSIFSSSGRRRPLTKEKAASMKRWKRESVNKRKEGSLFPVQLMSDIVTDAKGNPVGIVTTCEDITERKKMEQEIKNRVEELEKFYEMAIGREVKMKELKEIIKKLRVESASD
jgi:PAS domain S-box-containing protein